MDLGSWITGHRRQPRKRPPKNMDADFHRDIVVTWFVVTNTTTLETINTFTSTWEGFIKLCCIHSIFCNYWRKLMSVSLKKISCWVICTILVKENKTETQLGGRGLVAPSVCVCVHLCECASLCMCACVCVWKLCGTEFDLLQPHTWLL